jgi:putative ABC transport system permease protein
MSIFRRLASRLRHLFHRRKAEAEMAEEMRFHLDMRTEDVLDEGASLEDARNAALRRFGNVVGIMERARDVRGWAALDQFGRGLRLAVRSLRRAPGYTATAVLTLALGIGASTAIYSVVHALLVMPLQYRDASQLVEVQSLHKEEGLSDLAPATFGDLRDANASFAALAAQYYYYVNLTGIETPTRLNSADVTSDFFRLFDVSPLRGRTWTADDLKPGAPPVVVLGYALWRSQFNSSDSVVGRQIQLDDVAYTVIGVMPSSFTDPSEIAQLWRPMRKGVDDLFNRSSRYWTAFGRLRPGVTLERANNELAAVGRRLQLAHPENYVGWTLHAADLRGLVIGDYHSGLLVVLGAVACVMLITCANLTGLSIVRAAARRKELAIRTALGSSRGQLIGLLLTESLLLAVIGGLGGVLLANWGLDALLAGMLNGLLPRSREIALNVPVLSVSLALTAFTGLASGLASGFTASHTSAKDAFKDGARASAGSSARRLRAALIVTEIAVALVLLAGTGLLGRSFAGLMRKKPGLDAGRVLSLTVSLSEERYNSPDKCWDFFSRAEREVAALPGVESVGFTHTSPFRWGIPVGFAPISPGGNVSSGEPAQAYDDAVSVDYFKAIGCPLLKGRAFTPVDNPRSVPVVVLSAAAARRYFGAMDPIGRFITSGDPARLKVVGVVGDVRRSGLTADIPLQVYRPFAQRTPGYATLMVRTPLPPATLARPVEAALWRIDPNSPVSDVATMDTMVKGSVTQPRLYLALFSLFTALALLLAGIGLYGLITYSVEQRTREFGIRAALGASPRELLALALREGVVLIAVGLSLGLAGSLAAARLLQKMIFDTSPHDPAVFLAVPVVLAIVTGLASFFPALRATRVDPIVALRVE